MGLLKKKSKKSAAKRASSSKEDLKNENSGGRGDGSTRPKDEPTLARRRENRKSTIKSGRTIGEAREHLETANERAAARKKDKRKNRARIIFVTIIFLGLIIALICLYFIFVKKEDPIASIIEPPVETFTPTAEIVDEDAHATGGKITSRMREYIGQAEADFKDLGYTLTKAVLPSGTIREVDFYLDGQPGYIKTTIDRGAAVSVEDADRMLRYLSEEGTTEFKYIDVRIEGKAYWQ